MEAEWFARRLRELREAAGLSRKDLAGRAGLRSGAGIRNLEQGIRKPSWDTVVALCKALGVPCDAFLQPPGEPAAPATGRPRKGPGPAAQPPQDRPRARKPRRPRGG
jgi:transcriptional regulator with XRE-family HTH domain